MNPSIPDFDNLGALGDAPGGFGEDQQEAELNKAIEELRGVLHDEEAVDTPAFGDEPAGFAAPAAKERFQNSGIIMNIPVDVQIVLGSAEMPVSELMALQKGSTVALNRRIGEPVDVVVNGRKIACGEITVLENDPSRFGIKLTQIIDTAKPG
ncbi:flagellar motor switch protein FliN [Mesorhizobium microcysteis]|jgi:flagellar motor switch protein FliN/FliY|uniref:Flagellar motor switch protein FliN n=1 Tax=Neoaquamicrobium microcysteis TaxID=2682781 RepID=A0A5D4GQX3_9HYPH|nr:flagellar motor switch protein FliN [Mesorhizobium microcysteis]TYR30119.1 flagellar motor switch protein FliN [Mesorhizobium microcysteis]